MGIRVGYVLGRFPEVRNTFVVREMEAVQREGVEVRLIRLAASRGGPVDPSSARWLDGAALPSTRRGVLDLAWWTARRPLRTLTALARQGAWRVLAERNLRGAVAVPARAAGVARRLRSDGVQHLHAHFAWPADAAWFMSRLTDIPYSVTVHTLLGARAVSFPTVARHAVFIATPSHYTLGVIRDRIGGGGPPVHVVRAGLNTAAVPVRDAAAAGSSPRIACVAGLEAVKGHAVLLRALATDPDLAAAELDCVGDGPLRGELEERSRVLGLAGRVHFHGACTGERVRGLLATADVAVIAARYEADGSSDNIPVALMEAMALGVPVVSTRVGGIPELIEDGRTGWLAPPDDPAALGRALAAALGDPAERARRAAAARRHVEAEFDVAVSARRLADLFRGIA